MSSSRDDDTYSHKKAKGNVWLDDETEILVQLYGEAFSHAPSKYRPIQSYISIAKNLRAIGYNRSPHQIRNKIKALRASYFAARRGTDLDRQHCFMYEDLDKYFKNSCPDASHTYDDSNQISSDDPVNALESSSSHKRRRKPEDTTTTTDNYEFYDEYDYDDDDVNPSTAKTKTSKKPRISTTTNIERISLDENAVENSLIDFMTDQLEKQRQHQLEMTKIYTQAMNDQFKKFSDLISSFMQQVLDHTRRTDLNVENKLDEILNQMPTAEDN